MSLFSKKNIFLLMSLCISAAFMSCSKEEEVRMPDALEGVWKVSDSHYFELGADYTVHNLQIEYQDGMSIGNWSVDGYIYEPGYNIVIYLKATIIDVYEIVALSPDKMTWCWVDRLEVDSSSDKETVGHLIGDIIKKAQEGFHLDPELYETFSKISQDEFFEILEKLNIIYPW